ncbi:hypothetical protein [Olleya sp. R77988]|uniref:hypothetical protein n=1 Tax=Olleya sp. R77988 TaxID=3093875 RepID=UPI0037C7FB4A
MEALKLKIFDVLTGKITVSEFENWLYNCEEFISLINSNSFYFNVISINYKDEKWKKQLDNLVKEKYNENFKLVYKIERSCLEIIESNEPKKVYEILTKLTLNFDYDTDYYALWDFYSIHSRFDTFYGSMFNENELLKEAKFYAKQVIESTKNSKNFVETNETLMKELKSYESEKIIEITSLKQKLLAFFKKI